MRHDHRAIAWLAVVLCGVVLLASALPGGAPTSAQGVLEPRIQLPLVVRAADPTATVPAPTQAPMPTQGPTPTQAPTPSDWLAYLNQLRALGGLPAVTENPAWSDGAFKHARYSVKTDTIAHEEDPNSPWYTPEGDAAARNGNVMVHGSVSTTDEDALDLWMTGPFHGIGMIDPALRQVGFGSYREEDGGWQMAATLDVLRGFGSIPPGVQFPIRWPGDGQTMPYRSYDGSETPDPLTGCPGYTAPSGPPIYLQIGPGGLTPNVTASSFTQGGSPLEHCVFTETTYINPDPNYEDLARNILGTRDAVVLMPRQPLTPGATYTVSLTVNGTTHTWSFTVSQSAGQSVSDAAPAAMSWK